MKSLADDVYQLRGLPRDSLNVYLVGDVVIDAASRHATRRILRQLSDRRVSALALTHAHADHQGASHEICQTLAVPLWCGADDAPAMESGSLVTGAPSHWMNRCLDRAWKGPPHPVARRLREGDDVAGFTVLEVPGHTPGHVAYWREADRVLIVGDVLSNINLVTRARGLREPKPIFSCDPARNRQSARRLAELEPRLVCFGHGPPLRDPDALTKFVQSLP